MRAQRASSGTFGARMTATELSSFLAHVLRANAAAERRNEPRTPVCVWGTHGIGKTELVESVARGLGYRFAYVAPAQFEEMGDFLGMPRIDAAGRTTFAPPEWVPREPGPGVLLLDDMNRADGRILRGIMQLLQRHETMGWALPPGWQLAATANPDGGDYAVTPLDPAMLTRLLHATLVFEPKAWASWAHGAGIDPRGIGFVLAHPELVGSERTTPRTLVQLFRLLASVDDWKRDEHLVIGFAEACLDREAAAAFLAYVRKAGPPLPTPAEVLGSEAFEASILPRIEALVSGPEKELDALLVLFQRVAEAAGSVRGARAALAHKNLKALLLASFVPPDVRLVLSRELASGGGVGKKVVSDPEVASRLLGGT